MIQEVPLRTSPLMKPFGKREHQMKKSLCIILARDGFVHVENPDLQPLFALGLIKSKPAPRLFSDGFEDYVLNAAQRDRLDTKEQDERPRMEMAIGDCLDRIGHGSALDAEGTSQFSCAHAFFTSRSSTYAFGVNRRPARRWQSHLEHIVRLSAFDLAFLLEEMSAPLVGGFIKFTNP